MLNSYILHKICDVLGRTSTWSSSHRGVMPLHHRVGPTCPSSWRRWWLRFSASRLFSPLVPTDLRILTPGRSSVRPWTSAIAADPIRLPGGRWNRLKMSRSCLYLCCWVFFLPAFDWLTSRTSSCSSQEQSFFIIKIIICYKTPELDVMIVKNIKK